ncbi:hypothetical protein ACROYT_G040544 [Oculina patagonica]
MPTASSQFSQPASSFLSSSMVIQTNNHDTVQTTATSLTIHSTYKTFPTTNLASTTQDAEDEEDESKKRQIALICGACAGVVIVVASITAVICTHSNVNIDILNFTIVWKNAKILKRPTRNELEE